MISKEKLIEELDRMIAEHEKEKRVALNKGFLTTCQNLVLVINELDKLKDFIESIQEDEMMKCRFNINGFAYDKVFRGEHTTKSVFKDSEDDHYYSGFIDGAEYILRG